MIDIDDPQAEKVAEVLSNKTCKKILAVLAENEMTEGEIAAKLELPLNTIGYNVDKLIDAGLIEADKKFLWSVKGKRVYKYKVSNKRIIISPRIGIKGIVPALLVAALATVGIKIWSDARFSSLQRGAGEVAQKAVTTTASKSAAQGGQLIDSGIYGALANAPDIWAWYLLGALTALLIVILWNLLRKT